MNADLELARAVFPDKVWHAHPDGRCYSRRHHDKNGTWSAGVFDPLGAHFADVLAWLLGAADGAFVGDAVVSWFPDHVSHDGTASGIKQAVYEAAKRVVMEGKG